MCAIFGILTHSMSSILGILTHYYGIVKSKIALSEFFWEELKIDH